MQVSLHANGPRPGLDTQRHKRMSELGQLRRDEWDPLAPSRRRGTARLEARELARRYRAESDEGAGLATDTSARGWTGDGAGSWEPAASTPASAARADTPPSRVGSARSDALWLRPDPPARGRQRPVSGGVRGRRVVRPSPHEGIAGSAGAGGVTVPTTPPLVIQRGNRDGSPSTDAAESAPAMDLWFEDAGSTGTALSDQGGALVDGDGGGPPFAAAVMLDAGGRESDNAALDERADVEGGIQDGGHFDRDRESGGVPPVASEDDYIEPRGAACVGDTAESPAEAHAPSSEHRGRGPLRPPRMRPPPLAARTWGRGTGPVHAASESPAVPAWGHTRRPLSARPANTNTAAALGAKRPQSVGRPLSRPGNAAPAGSELETVRVRGRMPLHMLSDRRPCSATSDIRRAPGGAVWSPEAREAFQDWIVQVRAPLTASTLWSRAVPTRELGSSCEEGSESAQRTLAQAWGAVEPTLRRAFHATAAAEEEEVGPGVSGARAVVPMAGLGAVVQSAVQLGIIPPTELDASGSLRKRVEVLFWDSVAARGMSTGSPHADMHSAWAAVLSGRPALAFPEWVGLLHRLAVRSAGASLASPGHVRRAVDAFLTSVVLPQTQCGAL